MNNKAVTYIVLAAACAFSLLLALPTINNNIDRPNMIVYSNPDEGGQMDIIWSYYSQEKRESFQWEFDYGLEMRYLADILKSPLFNSIKFTPGGLVLILRWFNLAAWLLSFFALWRLISYHFKSIWQSSAAVLMLSASAVFPYLLVTMKPEPIILLLIILGLDRALRMIDDPSGKANLISAVMFASLAYIIKFAGLFLLPAIIFSWYIAVNNKTRGKVAHKPAAIIASRSFPCLVGMVIISLVTITIFFYVRKSTGLTFYEQYGLLGSIVNHKLFLFLIILGSLFMAAPLAIYSLGKIKDGMFHRAVDIIDEINIRSLYVFGIFAVFTLVFGFRWVIAPRYFVVTCSEFGSLFLGSEVVKNMSWNNFGPAIMATVMDRAASMDWMLFSLFAFYLIMEFGRSRLKFNLNKDSSLVYKRFVLLSFLAPFFMSLLSMGRFARHNMLPFFVIMSVLGLQGIGIFNSTFHGQRNIKRAILALAGILIASEILASGFYAVKMRVNEFSQREDIAFDAKEWFEKNIPRDAVILADHYIRIYIPDGYKNVKTPDWNAQDRAREFQKMAKRFHPQYIYYNSLGSEPALSIEQILPGMKTELLKAFDGADKRYRRNKGDKFFIYEILY